MRTAALNLHFHMALWLLKLHLRCSAGFLPLYCFEYFSHIFLSSEPASPLMWDGFLRVSCDTHVQLNLAYPRANADLPLTSKMVQKAVWHQGLLELDM